MLSPFRPWAKMKRKAVVPGPASEAATSWLYFTTNAAGRDHATARVAKLDFPQGCDQCAQLIPHSEPGDARSFRVNRGLKPTTLYLCGSCIIELCTAGQIPEPQPGE
jgi:hypothetical protein